jgi:hypothetical protein
VIQVVLGRVDEHSLHSNGQPSSFSARVGGGLAADRFLGAGMYSAGNAPSIDLGAPSVDVNNHFNEVKQSFCSFLAHVVTFSL